MNNLKEINKKMYQQYQELTDRNLSNPFLVSSEFSFKENLPKIMYIGKEMNGWGKNREMTLEELEQAYEKFSTGSFSKQTDYLNFIRSFYTFPQENNFLWANAIICGKNNGGGTPTLSKKLKQMSVTYLEFLYEYFKPEVVIIVCGNKNAYARVIKSFLNRIHISINNEPTRENPLVMNEDGTCFWTKHPSYLRLNEETQVVQEQIKKKVLK